MFRLWGRIWKDNHMLKDTVICDDRQETRTHKVFHCLEQICYELDLGNPIWLDTTVGILRSTAKHGFIRIISLSRLTSLPGNPGDEED